MCYSACVETRVQLWALSFTRWVLGTEHRSVETELRSVQQVPCPLSSLAG